VAVDTNVKSARANIDGSDIKRTERGYFKSARSGGEKNKTRTADYMRSYRLRPYVAKIDRMRAQKPEIRLKNSVARSIQKRLRKGGRRTHGFLGCSISEFKNFIESKFAPGMTWENYGLYFRGGQMTWHLDHIKPITLFDLSKEEQILQCFHYTNYQPMWADENIKKGNKYPCL
jgi:hypothetical protein